MHTHKINNRKIMIINYCIRLPGCSHNHDGGIATVLSRTYLHILFSVLCTLLATILLSAWFHIIHPATHFSLNFIFFLPFRWSFHSYVTHMIIVRCHLRIHTYTIPIDDDSNNNNTKCDRRCEKRTKEKERFKSKWLTSSVHTMKYINIFINATNAYTFRLR